MTHTKTITLKNQSGMSLVELMIAVLLGLILTAGAINIFLTNKATYRVENAVSRMQENGRFIIERMSKDIRMAGYSGCVSRGTIIPNVISDNPPLYDISSEPITGSESTGDNTWNPALDTSITSLARPPSGDADTVTTDFVTSDTLSVVRGSECAVTMSSYDDATNTFEIFQSPTCNFNQNQNVMVTDCASADIFKITNDPNPDPDPDPALQSLVHGNSGNGSGNPADNELSKEYDGDDIQVFGFTENTYYVAQSEFDANEYSIYVMSNSGGVSTSELAIGVEKMHIEYGIDTDPADNNEFASQYMDANEMDAAGITANSIRSVRIMLLLRSEDNITIEPRQVTFNGNTYNNPADNDADRRLRMVYTATVTIRNRLP